MKSIDYKGIGLRIKDSRNRVGITQEQLAERVEVSPSYISEIERGTSICSLAVLVNIADILSLNLDTLIHGININNANISFSEILEDIPKEHHSLYLNICQNIANSFK